MSCLRGRAERTSVLREATQGEERSKPRGHNPNAGVSRRRCRDANPTFSTDGFVQERRTRRICQSAASHVRPAAKPNQALLPVRNSQPSCSYGACSGSFGNLAATTTTKSANPTHHDELAEVEQHRPVSSVNRPVGVHNRRLLRVIQRKTLGSNGGQLW